MGSVPPARIIMITGRDERRAWEIIEAFARRTGLEARRSDRVAEFLISPDRDVAVSAVLTEIDREWRDHLDVGPLTES
jgi:hypothetical protein